MTFSISARCPRTGAFGIAISSSSPAVAARCSHARAGVGVAASQNITDPRLGQRALELMAEGLSADAALTALLDGYPHGAYRQLALVDADGGVAFHSGEKALGTVGAAIGSGVIAIGNLLAHAGVPQAMVEAYEAARGPFPSRLLAGLEGGLAAGGEAGPVHSAGLLVVRDVPWPIADLRVDWADDDPIGALRRLWDIYAPQLEAYVTRGLDPTEAPSFGVPGDP
ncbi:DUF1028 domain-containing protein [Chthonobacter albigriseus]|uniref:DUF1028 domain-containing protein n=1 Tax=Chthonobacter albigriseus TaxID=1683161 RepID=UPI0015EF2EEE|nr:DUF1028 domain-containing protein [Chthonobacter albigriseus]